jgi:hypothetical protein
MSRSATYIVASCVLVAAIGITCWQLDHSASKADDLADESVGTSLPDKLPGRLSARAREIDRESVCQKIADPSVRWEVRVDMLRSIEAGKLGPEEVDALYALLRHAPAAHQETGWWVVVNEIMEQMRVQAIGGNRFGEEMLAIVNDATAPEILRDYAVQHLGQWVSPRAEEPGQPSERDPRIVRETAESLARLVMASDTSRTSVPGTSLMVLVDMQGGGVPEKILNPVIESLNPWFAATLADRNGTGKITRISAISAIGMLHLTAHRPAIRNLATNETADPSLRLNSIAALGQIGEPGDIELLQTIAATDTRLRYAAQAALKNLTTTLR